MDSTRGMIRLCGVQAIRTAVRNREVRVWDECSIQYKSSATGIMARRREARKRTTRPGGMDTPTVEELLRLKNIDCTPFIYEVDGATTGTTANYIKKLSEIAKSRRGHDQQYFCAKWKTAIAMVLCKRGAQVAIRRGHTVNARRTTTHSAGHNYAGDGPLGSFGVEDPLVMGIEDSAAPKFADGAFY